MPIFVTLDDLDLSSIGIVLTEIGKFGAPKRAVSVSKIAGQSGGLLAATLTTEPRPLPLTFEYRGTSLADRLSKEDLLKDRLSAGLVTLSVRDSSNPIRQVRGIYDDPPTPERFPHPVDGTGFRLTANLLCPDPAWTAAAWSCRAITAVNTPVEIPLGTWSSPWILRVMGATTSPVTFTVKRLGGQTIGSMTFATGGGTSLALTTAEYLDLDSVRKTAEKVSGGVRTNISGPATFTAGDWPTLDPLDGYPAWLAGVTVELNTGTAELLYEKRYR